jgi:cytochrome oxidase assembly protein ShyY1
LIAALTERLAAKPVALPPSSDWRALSAGRDEFRRVSLSGKFESPQASVYSSVSALRSDASGLGAFVFAPVRLSSGELVVINRGFVPDGSASIGEPPNGPFGLTGYIRFPEKQGWFTPHEDQTKRLWFLRDHISMARANKWGDVAPFYIDLETSTPPIALPKPGPLSVQLKDNHLQYAITWFGLALVVAGAFAFWVYGQRRR